MKVDTSGDVLWRSDFLPLIHGGAADVDVAQLSDGNIAVQYEMDKFSDHEYLFTFITNTPAVLILDGNGKVLSQKVAKLPYHRETDIHVLQEGNGDYFSSGGFMYDHEDIYATITKHSNSGDTLWTKRCRHQYFDTSGRFHYTRLLVERKNGDILALGVVSGPDFTLHPWLFRVNSNGCFSEDDCGEVQVLVGTNEIYNAAPPRITLSPNAGADEVRIHSDKEYETMSLYDAQGVKVSTLPYRSTISIRDVPPGIYYLRLTDISGWGPMVKGIKI